MFGLLVTPQIMPASTILSVEVSSYSLSVATTVLSTVIIVIRILMVSRMPGASHQPRIAMEIVVESAILYSISAFAFTPMLSPLIASDTYLDYAELFFAYMAVKSRISYLPILIC
jgi:hypothetical protein